MEQAQAPSDDGDILVIEVDGKATPNGDRGRTQETSGEASPKTARCGCARHRGQAKRACGARRNGANPGIKVRMDAVYSSGHVHLETRRRWPAPRADQQASVGQLCARKVMLAWARRQATMRGFRLEPINVFILWSMAKPASMTVWRVISTGHVCLRHSPCGREVVESGPDTSWPRSRCRGPLGG